MLPHQRMGKYLHHRRLEPQYRNLGFRKNPSYFRARENILQEREMIYARLSENLPAFSQHDVKQSKKRYVLVKEYPGYIFIWIIMGSRGNTHK